MSELKETDIPYQSNLTKEQIKISIQKELSERSFFYFFKLVITELFIEDWEFPEFYKAVCDILQAEVERYLKGEVKQKDILINLPFRIGKSTLLEIFCVWLWIKDSKIDILNVCATQSLAIKSSKKSKNIITSLWFRKRWNIELAVDSKAKGDYSTKAGGARLAMGISSSVIGRNADFLIIDDPNDPSDSNSDLAIKSVIDSYRDVLYSRQNNAKGLRIICQQRVNTGDLCGWILKNNPEDYRHICLPAILNQNTSPGFEYLYDNNGLLFASRYGHKQLDNYQKTLSATAYASQLLQMPTALEGTILLRSWFKVIDELKFKKTCSENECKNFLFLDTAFTSDANNDPSAFLVCTMIAGKLYIIRAEEKREEFYELLESIKKYIQLYNVKKVYIEDKASGISIIQELKRQLRGSVTITKLSPQSKSKIERARAAQVQLNQLKVVLVEGSWNNAFLDQLTAFPYARHDDMVDVLVYAVLSLLSKKFLKETNYASNEYDTGDYSIDNLYD